MVGMEGKKWKRKGKTFRLNKMKKKRNAFTCNVINQAFLPIIDSEGVSTSAASTAPASSLCRAASPDKEKNEEALKDLRGFIFLCSGETKLDCFRFRVFGLRSSKKEIVEKIKPGAKLFLFDVELKLLYGVYEATSTGEIDLEPHAFGGKFPAQVQFQISEECLPLGEASFRHAIKGNYHGRKFEPELNGRQVMTLLSLFSPLAASATAEVVPQIKVGPSMVNVGLRITNPAFSEEHQDGSEQQRPLSTAYVDERNTGDDVESDSSEDTNSSVDTDSFVDTQDQSERQDVLSGFIFLCGGNTKPDCYRFRVFGLPSYKKETVEKIKPGTKLFLFDFELKLLYGVYEATSTGKVDLEPLAFGGKFPAQVKFRIYEECLPLSENSFRNAIKDNYRGRKFEPELNDQQVRNLLCLFHPLTASEAAAVPYPLPNVGRSFANIGTANVGMPKIVPMSMEDQVKVRSYAQATLGSSMVNVPPPNMFPAFNMGPQGKYPSMSISAEDPCLPRMQHVHPPPSVESQPAYELPSAQHGWLRPTKFVDNTHAAMEHQKWNAPGHAYSHQPYVTQGISQDPYLRPTNFVDSSHAVVEHQKWNAPSHSYSHQPYVTQGISQDPYLRPTNFVDSSHAVVEHQKWNAPSHSYSHQPYFTQGISEDPHLKPTNFVDNSLAVVEHQSNASSHAYPRQPYVTQGISQDPYLSSMQDAVPSQQQHLMGVNDRNYQLQLRAEQGMMPPQESSVTPNYYYGPSAPYVPQVLQQHSSETVIQEGTSSISIQKFICTETRRNYS